MKTQVTLATFTPGEAERVTGVSTAMQRDWRRRGFLPSSDGHARFDGFALAELLALKLLSHRGIGPQQSSDVSSWIAQGIMWKALQWTDAYEGDHQKSPPGLPDAEPWPEEVLAALDALAKQDGALLHRPEERDRHWGEKARRLARLTFKEKGRPLVIPGRYFIWWADGSHLFHESVDAAVDGVTSSDPKVAGAVVVLDQEALASLLLERAGRPLVQVKALGD